MTNTTAPSSYSLPSQYRRASLMLSSAFMNKREADIPEELLAGLTVQDAYHIQHANAERWRAHAVMTAGYKCEAVTTTSQEEHGIDEPIYGHIFDTQRVHNGTVDISTLANPEIRAVLVATFVHNVENPDCNVQTIRKSIDAIYPGLEITASRFGNWDQPLPYIVADQACSAAFALGKRGQATTKIDLKTLEGTLLRDGNVLAEGMAASIMGDPYEAAVWLVKQLQTMNTTILAGQTVILGPCTRTFPVERAKTYEARFKSLGTVSITIQ